MRSVVLSAIVLSFVGCASTDTNPGGPGFMVNGASGNGAPLGNNGGKGGTTAPPVQSGSAGMANPMNPTMRPPMNMPMAGTGAAGMSVPAAGMGAAGMNTPMAGAGGMPVGMPAPMGASNPTIPPVEGMCPEFRKGSVTLGGVSGIALEAGAKAAGPTAPMIVYWHGTGSIAGEYAGHSAFVQPLLAQGGVLVSFGASSGQGDSSCSGTFIFSLGDMDIIDQFVGCAVQNHNVDPRKIYTTGCSAGGLFAACLAAHRSNYIAAAAPNSGGFVFPQPFQNDWTPALMTMHGGSSDVVIVNFTDTSRTADMSFKGRGGFVINCNHGGRHCGGAVFDADVWKFFEAHPYGTKPSPWASALPAGFHEQCMLFQ